MGSPAEVRESLATWLSTMEWDWFFTLTFSKPRKSNALALVPRWIERSIWPAYIASGMAWAGEEFHSDGERLHIHGLLLLDPEAQWSRLAKAWRKIGRCKIERYDAGRGAVDYCAKYVSKDAVNRAEWQMYEWYNGVRV